MPENRRRETGAAGRSSRKYENRQGHDGTRGPCGMLPRWRILDDARLSTALRFQFA